MLEIIISINKDTKVFIEINNLCQEIEHFSHDCCYQIKYKYFLYHVYHHRNEGLLKLLEKVIKCLKENNINL